LKGLVAFDADGDGPIIVEIDEGDPGFERAAVRGGALVEDAGRRFDTALDTIRPIAAAFVGKIRQVAEPPDEVTVEFGLNLNLKAGAVLASSQAEAHLQVTLTWKKPSSTEDSPASAPRPAV
jgi:hypothetical protein